MPTLVVGGTTKTGGNLFGFRILGGREFRVLGVDLVAGHILCCLVVVVVTGHRLGAFPGIIPREEKSYPGKYVTNNGANGNSRTPRKGAAVAVAK